MSLDDVLGRLRAVRRQGRGWVARCPAHTDRNPSLSVREGDKALLIKCWAGCQLKAITEALGIRESDLFFDSGLPRAQRKLQQPKRRPKTWRQFAGELESEALGLWLRAERVLSAATGVDISEWSTPDVEVALDAIDRAHLDAARAACFERVAFTLRLGGLRREHARAS